jgi:hypothetical protein
MIIHEIFPGPAVSYDRSGSYAPETLTTPDRTGISLPAELITFLKEYEGK